jgi:hypothetical protein
MKTEEIFEKINKLEHEISELQDEIEIKENQTCMVMDSCPHEIVFKYRDDHPRIHSLDGQYYCPACQKVIMCYEYAKFEDSTFKNSRVIPLTNLSLLGTKEVCDVMREDVINNMELYYDSNVSTEELSYRMEELLKDKQSIYGSHENVLRRLLKKI